MIVNIIYFLLLALVSHGDYRALPALPIYYSWSEVTKEILASSKRLLLLSVIISSIIIITVIYVYSKG